MNIQKLKLRGAIGIKKGMGLDEISIDFSGLNGLIGIWGETGRGKTTIFENLQHYPQLVSRPHPALKNHFFLRDSYRELTSIHNGQIYETLIKVDPESGRSEGFFYIDGKSVVNGKISEYSKAMEHHFGSPTLFFNSVFCAQNSTKISGLRPAELKALFAEFLGPRLDQLISYEAKTKHAIAAVSGMISGIDNDIRRQRAVVEAHEDSAADLARKSMALSEAEREIKVTRQALATAEENLAVEKKAQIEQDKTNVRIDGLNEDLSRVRIETKGLEEQAEAELEIIRGKARTVVMELDGVNGTLTDRDKIISAADRVRELRAEIERVESSVTAARGKSEKATADLHTAEMESAEAARAAQEALTEIQAKITDAKSQATGFERAIADNERAISDLDRDPELTRLVHEVEVAREKASNDTGRPDPETDTRAVVLRNNIAQARASAARLEQCGTVTYFPDGADPQAFRCNSEDCAFITDALEAKQSLPGLNGQMDTRLAEIKAEIGEFDAGLAAAATAVRTLETAHSNRLEILEIEKKRLVAKNLTAKRELSEVKERLIDLGLEETDHMLTENREAKAFRECIETLRKTDRDTSLKTRDLLVEIDNLRTDLAQTLALAERLPEIKEAEAKAEALQAQKDELISEGTLKKSGWEQVIEAKKNRETELSKQVFELQAQIDANLPGKITATETAITEIKTSIESSMDRISNLKAEVQALERSAAEKAVAEKELDRLISEKRDLSSEEAEWIYLKDACGANGLRALEIEAVAPSITHDANQLLEKAFGSWAMVDFRTQDADGREVLEPRVIDQDGDSVLIGNRSGGQQVWALKALRLAMTMISKQKSGRDFLTAYADEDDAGLDVETARSFTRLYQAFMGQGVFEKCFMITHKREAIEMADHVLLLDPSGPLLTVPGDPALDAALRRKGRRMAPARFKALMERAERESGVTIQ